MDHLIRIVALVLVLTGVSMGHNARALDSLSQDGAWTPQPWPVTPREFARFWQFFTLSGCWDYKGSMWLWDPKSEKFVFVSRCWSA